MKPILVAAIGVVLLAPATAHALCSSANSDREIVGQIPDLVFTAGVPENRVIEHLHSHRVHDASDPWFGECGAESITHVPGLYITSTYYDAGVEHAPGTYAGLSGAGGGSGANVVIPERLVLRFDGSAPAGTVGRIAILARDGSDAQIFRRTIAMINVYVIAPGEPVPVTTFTVTGARGSISGHRLLLEHPLLDGNDNARMFVTHDAGAGVWPHPISVGFDSATARWSIQNDDLAAMPAGIRFHVRIDPSAQVQFLPLIDQGAANHNPYATIFVTAASPNPHPIAVRYHNGTWAIVNTDGTIIPPHTKFFVRVMGATSYIDDRYRIVGGFDPLGTNDLSNGVGVDIHAIGARQSGPSRFLDFSWIARVPAAAPLFITANATPLGREPYLDPSYTGVAYPGAWTVRHENTTPMNQGSSWNVWSPARPLTTPAPLPPSTCGGVRESEFSCVCGDEVCVDDEWTCINCHGGGGSSG